MASPDMEKQPDDRQGSIEKVLSEFLEGQEHRRQMERRFMESQTVRDHMKAHGDSAHLVVLSASGKDKKDGSLESLTSDEPFSSQQQKKEPGKGVSYASMFAQKEQAASVSYGKNANSGYGDHEETADCGCGASFKMDDKGDVFMASVPGHEKKYSSAVSGASESSPGGYMKGAAGSGASYGSFAGKSKSVYK